MLDTDNHIMNSVHVPTSLLSFSLHKMCWRMRLNNERKRSNKEFNKKTETTDSWVFEYSLLCIHTACGKKLF